MNATAIILRAGVMFAAWLPGAWLGRDYTIGLAVGSGVVLAFWGRSLSKQERMTRDH